MHSDTTTKTLLRRQLRARRRQLSSTDLQISERHLARQAKKCYRLLSAKRVASYSPFDSEISPQSISLPCARLFLPRITNYQHCKMEFYAADTASRNRFGIAEPKATGQPALANSLDVILLPLLGFDRHGGRLGLGAGYYDRALQNLSHQSSTRPFLIGLAHHFQEVKLLEQAPWDVRLDAILTDREFIRIQ